MIENEGWKVADEAANLLSVDREVCRRAFYKEPDERVYKVIQWILAEWDLPEHDPEQMIESWAREYGAGIYSRNDRRDDLERIEKIVARAVFKRDSAA